MNCRNFFNSHLSSPLLPIAHTASMLHSIEIFMIKYHLLDWRNKLNFCTKFFILLHSVFFSPPKQTFSITHIFIFIKFVRLHNFPDGFFFFETHCWRTTEAEKNFWYEISPRLGYMKKCTKIRTIIEWKKINFIIDWRWKFEIMMEIF